MEFGFTFEAVFLAGFVAFVVALLLLDLLVFNKRAHAYTVREALAWSACWVALALAFNVVLYVWLGRKPAVEFLTGYLIEEALSVDNLFVFLLIFSYFKVPAAYQHRVLFWGIIGAIVTRGAMIIIGAALIARFHWVLYVFGVFLLYAAFRMAFRKGEQVHPEHNPFLRLLRKKVRITTDYEGERFFLHKDGLLWATPLLPVVAVIESSDVMFATDSIPAIFGVTTDPLVVFTSNMFAILGLRTLYFLLAGVMDRFAYLPTGLSLILAFVAAKILIAGWYPIPTGLSLAVIAAIMALSILASIVSGKHKEHAA